jgi:hypothetical protein
MALSASGLYRLNASQLRLECTERGLSCVGPVRVLRRRLAERIKDERMDQAGGRDDTQASESVDVLDPSEGPTPPGLGEEPQGSSGAGQVQVFVELLRQVPPLSSEQPEDILRLFVRLGEIHYLGLVPDKIFITRILPLVSGSLLQFLGTCLREGRSWVACKSRLLEEYFPHFVRERLIRDLIVFNFQGEGQSMRLYVEQVFQAANFLQYGATEEQLVQRVVMNFHPDILNQAAFLDRPRSLCDLRRVAGLIEEKFSVLNERRRLDPGVVKGTNRGPENRGTVRDTRTRALAPTGPATGCWGCGQAGHFRRDCPQRYTRQGNAQRPGGQVAPGQNS